jgi:hypothetical protein
MITAGVCHDRSVETDVGERFAKAMARKDAPAMLELLDPQVDFRGLTPGRFWEAGSAAELVDDVILGHWFEPTDRIESIEGIERGIVADRHRVAYQFRIANDDGAFIVEQQAYFEVADDRITLLRVMCSGYRPVDAVTG